MNILKKFIYLILSIQEKHLSNKLDKHFKTSASNKTSKTVLGENITMTFTSETERNKELVLKSVTEIVSSAKNNPLLLLEYIKAHNTRVVRLNQADKLLKLIKEEEGLICELRGFEALYINLITDRGFSFRTKPIFVIKDGEIEPYMLIHAFYKWFSFFQGLPGFDYKSQKLFKKYLNLPDNVNFDNLSLEEMTGLKEAIARDSEATEFTINFANSIDGSKKVLNKIQNEGGADV